MTNKASLASVTGDSTKSAARKRGEKRTADVRARVKAAMSAIESEMAANEGIYPHRNGAVSAAEVARRAGIHPTSFFTEKLADLGSEVKHWLEGLKAEKVVGSTKAKKTLAARVSDWKRLYEALLQSHRDTELELQEEQHLHAEARKRVEALERENARLTTLLGGTEKRKVVTLRSSKD